MRPEGTMCVGAHSPTLTPEWSRLPLLAVATYRRILACSHSTRRWLEHLQVAKYLRNSNICESDGAGSSIRFRAQAHRCVGCRSSGNATPLALVQDVGPGHRLAWGSSRRYHPQSSL